MIARIEVYQGMTAEECEVQYNLRARRPDFETAVVARWIERSIDVRGSRRALLGLAYGLSPRQKLDVFASGNRYAPCLVDVYGIYWQSGDKSIYSFLAGNFSDAGIDCAILSYELCPTVMLSQIADQLRSALAWLWSNACACRLAMNGLVVVGRQADT